MKKISYKFYLFFLYIVYLFLLQFVYQVWVPDIYFDEGYVNNFNEWKFSLGVILLATIVFILENNGRPSSFFGNIFVGWIFIPSVVLFSGKDLNFSYIAVTYFSVVVSILVPRFVKFGSIGINFFTSQQILMMLFWGSAASVLGILYFGGREYLNIDFSKVYELRDDASSALPSIYNYIFPNVAKVLIPFGIAIALIDRRFFMVIFLFFFSFFLFASLQHKSPLVYPFAVLIFYKLSGSSWANFKIILLLILFVLIGGVGFYLYEYHEEYPFAIWMGSLFVTRPILTPASLNSFFLEFFSSADQFYWATSKISLGLLSSPHELKAPNIIGEIYFGNSSMSANAGLIGSGYANAGLFGVFLYSLFLGLLFSLLNSFAKKNGEKLTNALFSVMVITYVTSADFTDMLLTHGLFLAIVILLFLNRNKEENYVWNSRNI